MLGVRPCLPEGTGSVVTIVRGLAEYFGDDGQVERDAANHDT
jgi:hypothetical protein